VVGRVRRRDRLLTLPSAMLLAQRVLESVESVISLRARFVMK
jgi:hypothetical protein